MNISQMEDRGQILRILQFLVRYYIWFPARFNTRTTAFNKFAFCCNDIDIASYEDENTQFMVADNVNDLFTSLEQASNALFEWSKNNLLKSDASKCHLLVITNDRASINVAECKID